MALLYADGSGISGRNGDRSQDASGKCNTARMVPHFANAGIGVEYAVTRIHLSGRHRIDADLDLHLHALAVTWCLRFESPPPARRSRWRARDARRSGVVWSRR